MSAIHEFCARADEASLRQALSQGADPNQVDDQGYSPLIHALQTLQIECVELLLLAGADPQAPSPEGMNPLAVAIAWVGGPSPNPAKAEASRRCVRALLNAGADPDPQDVPSLLFLAIERQRPDCVKILLDAGADPERGNSLDRTAIFAAANAKDLRSLEFLAKAGANLQATDHWGQNVKQWAASWAADEDFAAAVDRWSQWQALDGATPNGPSAPKRRL